MEPKIIGIEAVKIGHFCIYCRFWTKVCSSYLIQGVKIMKDFERKHFPHFLSKGSRTKKTAIYNNLSEETFPDS